MGFSCFYAPEYLQQTPTGLFLFRIRVPKECRTFLKKNELKYSLKTRSLREARRIVSSILKFLKSLFGSIQLGQITTDSLSSIQSLIRQTVAKARRNEQIGTQSMIVYSDSRTNEQEHFEESSISLENNRLASKQPDTLNTKKTRITDVIQAFLKEKELSQGWRVKTLEDHNAVFSLFLEVAGDLPIEQVDKALMRDFKNTIIQLPPNMRKIGKYKDKSITEIIEMEPEKTISPHTINKYLSRLSNMLSYAVSHGYLPANPASGLKVRLKNRPDEERSVYTQEDLEKLFSDPDTSKDYTYWTPLIALYSGARLEEISQLHLEDIRKEQGVWIFDINDNGEKHLKNLSSSRFIPIHPHLIELGLIDHAKKLKSKGATRLFPELRKRRDGYGQTVGKWYQRRKLLCGIGTGKTFHSFRHTFITHLKHKQVDPFIIHEVDGHTINSETMGRYGKRYTPDILLKEAIEKINYGLILETLKDAWSPH